MTTIAARLLICTVVTSCVVGGQPVSAKPAPIMSMARVQGHVVFLILPPAPFVMGDGERAYLLDPAAIVQAIRLAEGVPSYGAMRLAKRYGGHRNVPESLGRNEAARIVHASYNRWRKAGRPGDFLEYLHGRYAPVNAANDRTTQLNRFWLRNVKKELGGVGL